MLCDILVLEINLNKNFQTCTTMAPLANLFELFPKSRICCRSISKGLVFFCCYKDGVNDKSIKKRNTHRGIIKKENRIYMRILRYKTNYKKWKY